MPFMPSTSVAHSPNEAGRWHDLREHLEGVGDRAQRFAAKFGAGEWAALAGLWHDLGKYHPDFQDMIRDAVLGRPKRRVDHSTLGALHARTVVAPAFEATPAMRQIEFLTLLLTATIGGHHAGLPEGPDALRDRLDAHADRYTELLRHSVPVEVLRPVMRLPSLPPQVRSRADRDLAVELLTRFVLSTVVDADRLDTERFFDEGHPLEEQSAPLRQYETIAALRTAVDEFIDRKARTGDATPMGPVEREVHRYRQAVLAACRQAASEPPGAFALDVATGGGKTLASLSFALGHGQTAAKDRVIIVIPFTSIIEQTADEYRGSLGALERNVLEHHSAVSEEPTDELPWGPQDRRALRRRLAAENWDAPIVVTTAVQFLESLHSASPSRCRKLHNVANSIVILDEAQMLPPRLLNPTVWVLNELVERYGTTVVLSTATQPALEPPFPTIRNLRQIVPPSVPRPPPRVRAEVLGEEAIAWGELAAHLAGHDQVLCITHKRPDARDLTREVDRRLGSTTTIHLSAAMCARHRSTAIREVRRRLATGESCRVVSTQLVEAGVDLDFPVVYRALAGIDSMVQAAGRANREGKLGVEGGRLRIFRAPTKPPPGLARLAADAADGIIRSRGRDDHHVNLFDPDLARTYFRRLYGAVRDKDGGVSNLRRQFRFRAVEEAYRLIDDAGLTVVIPLDSVAVAAVETLRRVGARVGALRRLQPYTVSLFPQQLLTLQRAGAVRPLLPPTTEGEQARAFALNDTHSTFYDGRFGLLPEGSEVPESGALIT